MKAFWKAVLYIIVGILAAGIVWLACSLPRGTSIQLIPPPTPAPIQVHIIGEIKRPGVYELPVNSRVQDAIREAGGLTETADDQAINLAALLEDGQQIRIPPKGLPLSADESSKGTNSTYRSPESVGFLININTAALELLETLPGIGPVIAKEIINYRQNEGDFKVIEEIQKVHGIGPTIYEDIKDLITVDNP